jgi:hypothetical protein
MPKQNLNPNRREFLQAGAATVAAASLMGVARADQKNDGGIPMRPLGRTGQMVTMIARRRIESSTLEVAGDGRFELFKSSKMYDGPVHRKQHGFDTDTKAV